MNLGLLPFGIFEGLRRQLTHGGLLDLFEKVTSRPTNPTHGAVIEVGQELGDDRVQGLDREEPYVAQPRQDPALDDQHRAFNLPIVTGFSWPGRQHGGVVMRGHVGKGLGDRRLEPQRLDHRRLQIVADDAPARRMEHRGSTAQRLSSHAPAKAVAESG